MQMTEIIFSAVLNILSIYIDIRAIKIFLKQKKKNTKFSMILYFLVWSINWGIFYIWNNVILTISSLCIGLFLIAYVMYEGNWLQKLISVFLTVSLGYVVENFVWVFLEHSINLSQNEAVGSFFSTLVFLLLVLILEKCFRFHKIDKLSKENYLNVIIILFSGVVLSEILVLCDAAESKYIMIGLSVLCLSTVSNFYLYDKINEVYIEKLEQESMQQQIAMYENQISVLKQSQKKVQGIRHDIHNHLYLLDSYLKNQEYENARKYIAQIYDYMVVPKQYSNTCNQEIDIILNHMIDKAVSISTQVETELEVPNTSFMPKIDLNIILSNLLDNAIEALEKADTKYLRISLKYRCGIFVIEIQNSFQGVVHKIGAQYITQKEDKVNHGLGMQNIQEVVERYNGNCQVNTENNMFSVRIIIYTETVQE